MQIPEFVTNFYKYIGEVATIGSKMACINPRFLNAEPRMFHIN